MPATPNGVQTRKKVKKVIEKTKSSTPFVDKAGLSQTRPSTAREMHRGRVLSSLRHLRAPAAFRRNTAVCHVPRVIATLMYIAKRKGTFTTR